MSGYTYPWHLRQTMVGRNNQKSDVTKARCPSVPGRGLKSNSIISREYFLPKTSSAKFFFFFFLSNINIAFKGTSMTWRLTWPFDFTRKKTQSFTYEHRYPRLWHTHSQFTCTYKSYIMLTCKRSAANLVLWYVVDFLFTEFSRRSSSDWYLYGWLYDMTPTHTHVDVDIGPQ